jgi:putative Holliday junction resolvase
VIGRTLAVDYGGKRTGLAVCDPLGIAAHPLAAVVSTDLDATVAGIVHEVRERDVQRVLVGIPYLPDGREGEQAQKVRVFLSALRPALPARVEVLERDERHTTREAQSLLRDAGLDPRKHKDKIDSLAAVVILREWMDSVQ